jgi:ATP/maltotriose-dependent transcriptional regulator MalT
MACELVERFDVSRGTVKRHTHHFCGKLDVNKRTQAIIRSQDLRLLA